MFLAILGVEFALPGAGAACRLFQGDIDKCATHLVARRGIVHHFRCLDAAGRDAAQQGIELPGTEGGYFAVQDNGDSLACQLQPAIHLDDAGKLFHGIVGIVHGEIPDKAGQVIHQFALCCLYDGAFTGNHHLRQGLIKAVQTGIGRDKAVSAEDAVAVRIGGGCSAVVLLCRKTDAQCTAYNRE